MSSLRKRMDSLEYQKYKKVGYWWNLGDDHAKSGVGLNFLLGMKFLCVLNIGHQVKKKPNCVSRLLAINFESIKYLCQAGWSAWLGRNMNAIR